MDRESIVAGLIAQNVPRAKAEKRADELVAEAAARDLGGTWGAAIGGRHAGKTFAIEREAAAREAEGVTVYRNVGGAVTTSFRFPFRLTLPWSHLISDNEKYAPAIRGGKPALILTVAYRNAKRLAAIAARKAWGDGTTYDEPIALHAKVFFPRQFRKGDSVNFSKCACDALQGIVYASDDQIFDNRWTRAGVDVDAPRAEITISLYTGNL